MALLNKLVLVLTVIFITTNQALSQTDKIINMSAYGINSGDADITKAVRSALDDCKRTKAGKLIFPKGRYDFWPDKAVEKYMFISNNDAGLKRVAFSLDDFENFEIDGQGSQFIFHGFICPFILDKSKNIKLTNFSIDWERTFHSEGEIIATHDNAIDVSFSDKFPYKIENGLLVFTDAGRRIYPYGSLLEFDSKKRETAYMAKDYYTGPNVPVKEIGNKQVRLFVPGITGTPGNILVFGALNRRCPAITISDTEETCLTEINIFHCGGMGVIAQRSKSIELNKVCVTPSPQSGRIVSITADATHFVNCTGKIRMSNCLFENQEDDATNIHGIYAQIISKISPNTIEVKLKHEQQFGFDFIKPGEKLELVHSDNMMTYRYAVVKTVKRLNKEFTRIELVTPLPNETITGDVVASMETAPDVIMQNCVIRNNRARGLLLGSRGKILVENNTFHTPGAAILFEGDARFWFEQAGVRNVVIKNNNFDNCNFGIWGNAAIQFGPGIEELKRAESRYNRNILIEKNTFNIFDPRIINGYSIESLIFRDNTVKRSQAYKNKYPEAKSFEINSSSNIFVETSKKGS